MGLAAFNRMRRLKAQQEAATETPEVTVTLLDDMTYPELRALAKEHGIEDYYRMNTEELREALKEDE